MTDEIKRLLAGYATRSLTSEEQQRLMAASLEDPELFAALADEQVLRDTLDDPAAKAELVRALTPESVPARERFAQWLLRPAAIGSMCAIAALCLMVTFVVMRRSPVMEVAQVARPARQSAEVVMPAQPDVKKFTMVQEKPTTAVVASSPLPSKTTKNVAPPAEQDRVALQDKQVKEAQPVAAEERQAMNAPSAPPPTVVGQMADARTKKEARPDATAEVNIGASRAEVAPEPVSRKAMPAAPPAPAPSVTQSVEVEAQDSALVASGFAASGPAVAPLTYTLARKNAAGDWDDVPNSTRFDAGESVRVTVRSMLPVTVIDESSQPHAVSADTPYTFVATAAKGDRIVPLRWSNLAAIAAKPKMVARSAVQASAPQRISQTLSILIRGK